MFKGKTVVLGISGGIAAYKSPDIVRRLKKRGANVCCVMTEAAREFVTPLTLQTLSQNPVICGMFSQPQHWNVEHIALADKADIVMIVPATANIIGKIAHGIASDFLTTMVMACRAPILLAPAMNVNMYENPITQENISKLKTLGYCFVEPGFGDLACGTQGKGRLAEPEEILEMAEELLAQDKPLKGIKVLVTAGPTREALDPVRYITNHSTGKMGYAIAKQARLMGAEVTLISGPSELKPFQGIKLIKVVTAREMHTAVMNCYEENRIIIKAAAVGDYRPEEEYSRKIKKSDDSLTLKLAKNPDILRELGRNKGERVLIGFAAETHDVHTNAAEKIHQKNLDFIAANDLQIPGAGFAADTNIVTLIFPDGKTRELPKLCKEEVAREILREALKIIEVRGAK